MIPPSIPPPLPPSFPPPPALDPAGHCGGRGTVGPTKQVTFFQHIGAVVLMFNRHISGRLCRNCINEHFTTYTAITAVAGWWGMLSCIITPFVLLNNVIRYVFCLGLKPAANIPENKTVPAILELLLACGALAVVGLFVAAVVS